MRQSRECGGFKRDLKKLVAWLLAFKVELVILESTGIYWKSVFAHLGATGIPAWVVSAHHVEHVPGRKTENGCRHDLDRDRRRFVPLRQC